MKPNILFFLTDQQRWDSTGLHGNPLGLTPNLDAVAAENLHIKYCFSPQPVCGPARACLQSGRYATQTGCITNGKTLPQNIPTLAGCFKEGGYDTAYFGKWHLAGAGQPRGPVAPEFRGNYEYWLGAEALEHTSEPYRCIVYDNDQKEVFLPGYRVDALTDAVIRYISEPREKPFFLFLSVLEPHHQNSLDDYVAPEGYRERYQGRWMPSDLQALGGAAARHLGGYWGCIKRIDEAYGRIRDALRSSGLLENTIVVFTSDHGCHFRTRAKEYKRTCHEASIRIPGVISGPGFEGAGSFSGVVSLLDFPPTLLDAAGIDIPPCFQGRSLMPQLRGGEASSWPQDILIQTSEVEMGRALRTKRWKYGISALDASPFDVHASRYIETSLYDLGSDPHELDNLVAHPTYEPLRRNFRIRILERMREAGEPEAAIEPAPATEFYDRQRVLLPEEIGL